MRPKVLVLDEPTAGLDPKGRDDILDQIAYLHKQSDMTVILVSHSMEDIARYADRIIVMNKGSVMYKRYLHIIRNWKKSDLQLRR